MHPVMTPWLHPGTLMRYAKYVQVRRLEALLSDKPAEFDEDWYDTLSTILHRIAPKVLASLTPKTAWELFTHGIFNVYKSGEVVFLEGDAPDGYYICLHGHVAVHKLPPMPEVAMKGLDLEEAALARQYGSRLARMDPGSSFGEVGFSSHATGRVATVVALGEPEIIRYEPEFTHIYGRTICYVIPAAIFAVVYGESTKQLDEKLDTLKANRLYQHWPDEELYKLAVRMQRKIVKPKHNATDPDHPAVAFIRQGAVRVHRRTPQNASSVDVGLLGSNDLFGLCEMMCLVTDERWLVAETEAVVFIVPLAVASDLSRRDALTSQLLSEKAAARRKWERACMSSRERVANTPETMQHSSYLVDPNGLDALIAKRNAILAKQRPDDFECTLNQASKLLVAAAGLEADEHYLEAEEVWATCINMYKAKLKKLRRMRKDGTFQPQHTSVLHEFRQRMQLCEERITKAAQLRIEAEMDRGRLKRRGNAEKQDLINLITKQAQKTADIHPHIRVNEWHNKDDQDSSDESDDSQSEWSESSLDDMDDEMKSEVGDDGPVEQEQRARGTLVREEEYGMNIPSVSDDMNPVSRRKLRLEALDFALSLVTSDELKAGVDVPQTAESSYTSMTPVERRRLHFGQNDLTATERREYVSSKIEPKGYYTVLNDLQVTPTAEIRRNDGKKSTRRIGSALVKSRSLQESTSLLSLDQERQLGQYGLPQVSRSSSIPDLHRKPRPNFVSNPGRQKPRNTRLQVKGMQQTDVPKQQKEANAQQKLPPIHWMPIEKLEELNQNQPPFAVRKLIYMHHCAEQRRIVRTARRSDLYAKHQVLLVTQDGSSVPR